VVVLFEEIGCADKREAYGAYILYSQTLYSSLIAFYRCLFFESTDSNAVVLVPMLSLVLHHDFFGMIYYFHDNAHANPNSKKSTIRGVVVLAR